jgi:hypothetical protein
VVVAVAAVAGAVGAVAARLAATLLATAQTATTDTIVVAALGCDRDVHPPAMPYEPGSPECRVLIDCKTQIESMLLALGRIESSEPIREQLRAVHHQLETLHAQYRKTAD